MKSYEFFHEYANLPLETRFIPLNMMETGLTNMNDVYKRIHELEELMRPYIIEEQKLLETARKALPLLREHYENRNKKI